MSSVHSVWFHTHSCLDKLVLNWTIYKLQENWECCHVCTELTLFSSCCEYYTPSFVANKAFTHGPRVSTSPSYRIGLYNLNSLSQILLQVLNKLTMLQLQLKAAQLTLTIKLRSFWYGLSDFTCVTWLSSDWSTMLEAPEISEFAKLPWFLDFCDPWSFLRVPRLWYRTDILQVFTNACGMKFRWKDDCRSNEVISSLSRCVRNDNC